MCVWDVCVYGGIVGVCVGCVWGDVCVGVVCVGVVGPGVYTTISTQYWGRAPTFRGNSAYQQNRGNGPLCVSLQIIAVTMGITIT